MTLNRNTCVIQNNTCVSVESQLGWAQDRTPGVSGSNPTGWDYNNIAKVPLKVTD